MKILLHALGVKMGGGIRHLTNFLPELGSQDPAHEYVVLMRESTPEIKVTGNIRIERIADAEVSGWIRRSVNDILLLPRKLKREKFSAIVSLANFGPIWSPVPHVIFQQNALYYWDQYLAKISGREKIETLLRRRLAIESMKRAALIVTPSHAMTDMIKKNCPELKHKKFKTLYHGFSKSSLGCDLDDKFKKLLSVSGFKMLYPTHLASYKGFEILFKMLVCLKEEGVDFILFAPIDPKDWPEGFRRYQQLVRELGLEDRVIFMGTVPQDQMGALYEKCDLMVYPSLCESFGFSMIEAIGHGMPIVAAGTAVNKEICGEGALYYPPADFKQGAEMIKKALVPEVSAQLIDEGKKRLSSFDWSWKRYAEEFVGMVNKSGIF